MCYMWRVPHSYPKSEGLGFRVSTISCAGQGPEAVERVQGASEAGSSKPLA